MAYNNPTPEIYRGDIFYIMQGSYVDSEQKSGRPGIIVSNDLANKHSPNVEVVFLTSQEKKALPTHVEVIARVPSIALCENIQTVSKKRLSDFIRSCTTSEMKAVDNALLCSLGIEAPSVVGGAQETEVSKKCSGSRGRKKFVQGFVRAPFRQGDETTLNKGERE